MSRKSSGAAAGIDPFGRIYVHALGPARDDVYVSLSAAFAHLPAAVAASTAGTWGRFAELVPAEAAKYRAQMARTATWKSWEVYRDAQATAEGPPRTEAEIRAAWEALDWTCDRGPLDGDPIDLESLVTAGWEGRNTMYDPFQYMDQDLPAPIASRFLHGYGDMCGNEGFCAIRDDVSVRTMCVAFGRLGCLVVEDQSLLSGFWDGIYDLAELQVLIARYRAHADGLRKRLPAFDPRAWDNPHLFDDIVDFEEDAHV